MPIESLADQAALLDALRASNKPTELIRAQLSEIRSELDAKFRENVDIRWLISERARRIDVVLGAIWSLTDLDSAPDIALAAVGGYGRGELHPHSDIDLLIILSDEGAAAVWQASLERFITALWDTGLTIGHAVRTVQDCRQAALDDITIATNLMESRTLAGNPELLARVAALTGPDQIWPSADFFRAKWDEQIERHRKFNNTEYNLEPNLKGCPGGLRDVQTIAWVAKRHFGDRSLKDLLDRGFLNDREYRALIDGQNFLWRVRYALHMLTGRGEDRLLFDHQLRIAEMFGYENNDHGLAVEHFMKTYFRWVLRLGVLNESLTQLYDEAILRACEPINYFDINLRFRVRNGYMEAAHDNVFKEHPAALIEMFTLMTDYDFIVGVRAETIRQVYRDGRLIDETLRQDPEANRLFLKLLGANHFVATNLNRMKRYGVLGRFIPEFGRVIGQTQHDMFHVYSVDSHTLLVVRNIRKLFFPGTSDEYPTATYAAKRLPRRELLLIAGLFHDIGKGRGGDHSELGAQDALAFCNRLGLSAREGRLVAWLVENHLIMSTTAQRKDISDPDVIAEFAQKVGDQVRLDYLYTLTIADINGTNPTLYNSWKASLLQTLYLETKRALRRGLEHFTDARERIEETRQLALQLLVARGLPEQEVIALWSHMGDDYFLREQARDIVWHTESIIAESSRHGPLVLIKQAGTEDAPLTQIFVYAFDRDFLFAIIAASLHQLGLDVYGARIYSSADHHSLDSFFVLEQDGSPVNPESRRSAEIRKVITDNVMADTVNTDFSARHTSRALKHFAVPTRTRLTTDEAKGVSILEINTPDRAGLLARIGRVFFEHGVRVQNARITTLGASVEDVFYITDGEHLPIRDEQSALTLQQAIREALDTPEKAGQQTINV